MGGFHDGIDLIFEGGLFRPDFVSEFALGNSGLATEAICESFWVVFGKIPVEVVHGVYLDVPNLVFKI